MNGSRLIERAMTPDGAALAVLERLPLLQVLPAEVRSVVVSSFVPLPFSFGAVISREGDPADALFVVMAGRLRIVTRDRFPGDNAVGAIGPGQLFVDVALFEGGSRRVSLRASGDGWAMRLDKHIIDAVIGMHPEFRSQLEHHTVCPHPEKSHAAGAAVRPAARRVPPCTVPAR